jgi:pilus assembly protein Flp/PilA
MIDGSCKLLPNSDIGGEVSGMGRFARCLRKWWSSEDGTTSVEYAILLALIILVCFSAIASIGNPTLSGFQQVITKGGFGSPSP